MKLSLLQFKFSLKLIFPLLLLSVLLSACGGGLPPSSWPSMLLDQDMLYVSYYDSILAVNAASGAQKWRFPEKIDPAQTFYARPALANGVVIVGGYNNVLHALDANSGVQKWDFKESKGRYIGGALIVGNAVFAPSADYSLYILDIQGKLNQKFETGQALWARPVTDGKTIYLPSMDRNLYAINAANYRVVWKKEMGAAMIGSPTLSEDGILFVPTLGNQIVALKAADGALLWKFPTKGSVWSAPLLREKVLYFGDTTGAIYALNATPESPSARWQSDLGSTIVGTPAASANGLFFTTEKGDIYMLNFNGEKQWTKPILNSKLYASPIVANDLVIVAVNGGEKLLVAFDFNGTEKWSLPTPK